MTGAVPTKAELLWAERIPTLPHYVLTKSPADAAWPNTRFLRDLDDVAALKARPGKDIYLMGGGQMVRSLIEAGLVDELRLITYPVIAGGPHALFGPEETRRRAELASVRDLPGGLILSAYLIGSDGQMRGDETSSSVRFCRKPVCVKPREMSCFVVYAGRASIKDRGGTMDGHCHCGAVTTSVPDAPAELTDCNCWLCRRYGALWADWPREAIAVSGPTETYLWGRRALAIHRCKSCGCLTHWSGLRPDIRKGGVKARLLDGFPFDGAKVVLFDGASFD